MKDMAQDSANRACLRALELIQRAGVPPSPENYELFYRYATGTDEALEAALEDVLDRGDRPNQVELDRVYKCYVADRKILDEFCDLGDRFSDELYGAMGTVQEAIDSNSEYGHSLEKAGEQLGDLTDPAHLRTVLRGLVHATGKMGRCNIVFDKRLKASSVKIRDLERDFTKLREELQTDSLTGVANRNCFYRTLGSELSRAIRARQPFCLCMIDVDRFQRFNDTFGHRAGDSALRLVASIMRDQVREYDVVARIGGEEFAVILPNTELEAANGVAERIRTSLMSKELIKRSTGESMGRVTISTGVAQARPEDSAESLIERADANLHAAKQAGRNRTHQDEYRGLESAGASTGAA